MATISLEGMQFQGYHGVYPAERILGSTFIVDVHIDFNLGSVKNDDLATAFNYESVYHIVDLLMTPPTPLSPAQLSSLTPQEREARKAREPKNLIETLVQQIFSSLKKQYPNMHGVKVRIKKMNPPLPGRVESSTIEAAETYIKDCPKCKDGSNRFSCYKDGNCWCKNINVHEATLQMLTQQYDKKCLCPKCLSFYAHV